MTKAEILELIKDAMKSHDKVKLSILRQVNEEFKRIEVDERREVTEADVTACVKRLIKVTGETLEYSRKAATNEERTADLARQVEILEGLLPTQLAGADLEAAIDELIVSLGATTKRDIGKIMGVLTQSTSGNFDKPAAAKYLGSKL